MGFKILWFLVIALFTVNVLQIIGQKYIYRIENTVESDGYHLETHHVMTSDSYMLALHRIPHKRFAKRGSVKKPVVLLMHGMFGASNSFISLGPDYSIAYNLVDAGFDVWMGNARGTKLSRFHNDLDPDDPADKNAFFDFTFEEIGLYDLAELTDYILTITDKPGLHYIGFGAGGTAFLVLNSMRPAYNARFLTAHLLAGVGYQRFFKNRLLLSLAKFSNTYYKLWSTVGLVELFPPGSADDATMGLEVPRYCTGDLTYRDVCEMMGVAEIMGTSLLNTLVDSETAGASVKQVAHYGQNIKSRKFQRWDLGKRENMDMYGTAHPPEYELGLITVNVTLHYSEDDHLVDRNDILGMARAMPNCAVRKVPYTGFQHFDFIISKKTKHLVTDSIVRSLRNHEDAMKRGHHNKKWYKKNRYNSLLRDFFKK